ncbi:ADP-ribose glycohydrolase ARH3-like isoform X1 [Homalodisca vitripennis]|uniref:ADP-ribose glycohydrolase ARH3-like isoform X1 n=2 Tax=Homalodisca vitripennis TaxID=197043 RepID=UPI001EEB4E5F|nr:ADP-ribose glycohydrolase ARH3-like isoform X1 [Homalodisca vitripennis]
MIGAAAILDNALLKSKVRGCLVGALLGDCLGSPYEGDSSVSKTVLQNYFDKLSGPYFKNPTKMYTDDTAMTKCISESLIDKRGLDSKDLAKRFVKEYFNQPKRGYGPGVVEVFHKLKNEKYEDIWRPAKQQFDGSGSFGNGGAMRVAPIALFYRDNYDKMVEAARQVTLLTHTNRLGVNGALLQCIAVYLSLHQLPGKPLDVTEFSAALKQKMGDIEKADQMEEFENKMPYTEKLKAMDELLKDDNALEEEVQGILGHDISALNSVPTAVYCFLRSQKPIPNIKTDCPFRRTIQYAISLGGDTDTIASMAGAIAGAFYGMETINESLQKHCEFVNETINLADKIIEKSVS